MSRCPKTRLVLASMAPEEAPVEAIISSVDLSASGEEVMGYIMGKLGEITPESNH